MFSAWAHQHTDTTALCKAFVVTATPCKHLPPGECTRFMLTTESFGVALDGRPNAVWSHDAVYVDKLRRIGERFRDVLALMNVGVAVVQTTHGLRQITMDGKHAARLFQGRKELAEDFEKEGIDDKVTWLTSGSAVTIF
ncbi:hypothetical protein MY11210_008485 [Beauveria gryllotalpidicola]